MKYLLLSMMLMVMVVGCESVPEVQTEKPLVKDELMNQPLGERFEMIGTSVKGLPIHAFVHGSGDEVVLLMASIHGNEAVGTPLLNRLREYLQLHPEYLVGRTVVIIPEANPDGMLSGTRYNANGVDLNRNYPAANRVDSKRNGKALSEPETVGLYEYINRVKPKRVVSIHQPFGLIDYDGPGKQLAEMMSAVCDMPVKKLGARAGSMGAYMGEELGIPIITVEFLRSADKLSDEEMWAKYHEMLLVSIVYPQKLGEFNKRL